MLAQATALIPDDWLTQSLCRVTLVDASERDAWEERQVILRTLRHLVVGALALTMLTWVALPAGASPGSKETVVLKRSGNDLTEIGWWAQGAFVDSGSWTSDFRAFSAGPVFAGTIKTTETNDHGTGTFRITFQITGVPNSFQGNWQITDGTGIYTHLRGAGKWTEADDPVNGDHVFTCTGAVHVDP